MLAAMVTPADLPDVRALLIAAARGGRDLSYSEVLLALGHRFTRPKMRSLCKLLDAIDAEGRAAGQPELAVLVVRESDRLPGQGWWVGRSDAPADWTGPAARAYVDACQARAFAWWAGAVTAAGCDRLA
ncbi:ribose-phosphate pyrophosphokinase [Sandarakinorhabdus cyanobacteriorum]|nr:ribose-phosphate pyrophosphokinase [Sandarakinorhabdus cyanobacteriorum]